MASGMATTKNAPKEITRKTREKVQPNDPLFSDWNFSWSGWVLAMTPRYHEYARLRNTTDQAIRLRKPISSESLKRRGRIFLAEYTNGKHAPRSHMKNLLSTLDVRVEARTEILSKELMNTASMDPTRLAT